MAETAALLGRDDDAAAFRALADRTRAAFDEHYVTGDGTILSDCTTVYALAIVFGLLDEETEQLAGERLAELVAEERPPDLHRVRRYAVHHRRADARPATSTTPTACCSSASARPGSTR